MPDSYHALPNRAARRSCASVRAVACGDHTLRLARQSWTPRAAPIVDIRHPADRPQRTCLFDNRLCGRCIHRDTLGSHDLQGAADRSVG